MKNFTLEVSLKPFYGLDAAGVRAVCDQALTQWEAIIHHADTVSMLLWASDGSEILEYAGDLDAPMEWARYLGNANAHTHGHFATDPEGISIHSRSYLYRDDAGLIPYRRMAEIFRIWREAIVARGKPARLGLAFDPGGEFAPSVFKYQDHREICLADTLGKASFVCCYGVFDADNRAYAGFPEGIPQGTSVGTFLGRQTHLLAADMGFDFIWLSNGFGFGMETWMVEGPLFDSEKFTPDQAPETRDRILAFWRDFRRECPDLDIETRGTNLGTSTDLASDATPLRELYEGGFRFAPPPNSPWAAINGDFGIEIAGYLSRIVELPPDEPILFRFYTHDPWWLNSPWLDRYERQPHDIYLPTATARVTAAGRVETARKLALLTIDDSHGLMPEAVPNETIPHFLRAWEEQPDAAGPVVWLYPFDEVHDAMFQTPRQPERLFHTDWCVREALNGGVPVNTVISTRSFAALGERAGEALGGRVLLSPAPFNADTEQRLLDWADRGGDLILYGPLHSAPRLRERLGLEEAPPLEGLMTVHNTLPSLDTFQTGGEEPATYTHRNLLSGGGLAERTTDDHAIAVTAAQEGEQRALAARFETAAGGRVWWVRGPLPLTLLKGGHLPHPDDRTVTYPLAEVMRQALADLGWRIAFNARTRSQRHPVLTVHRHDNGWFFSGYVPDTQVEFTLRSPYGAPLLLGMEAWLENGAACYHQQRGWRAECRVFIEQAGGRIIHKEECPKHYGVTRRFSVDGLQQARVRFFPPREAQTVDIWVNPQWPFVAGERVTVERTETPQGTLLTTTEPVTGNLLFSW